jgi:putative transposase
MSAPDRRAMVERPGEDLSVRRQCALLNLARSGVYRPKAATGADDLALMRRIDELHLLLPFYGSRRMMFELNKEGRGVNRKRVQRLMRVMGIEALVPRPGTSQAAPGHKIYPYLLRGVTIAEPNHVWAADITYIPMAHGSLYLVAIIDWASRAVLAWRLSNTMDTSFCLAALDEALARYGKPRIFNTDQGAQFTSAAFTGKLEAAGVAISMDGRGRFMDNIFIERLWRSIKYEEVRL